MQFAEQTALVLGAAAAQPAPLEPYKLASTVFLGIGIAAVLQGRLVPRKPDFPISDRARGLWATVDIVAAFAVLVCIAVGEVIALKVIRAGQAEAEEQTAVVALLATTAGYVVVSAAIQRALPYVWEIEQATNRPVVQRKLVVNFSRALIGGLALGTGIALLVLRRAEIPATLFVVAGLVAALFGTRRLSHHVTRSLVLPGYKQVPISLDDVVRIWTAGRIHGGLSVMGGKLILTKDRLVFTPWDLDPTLSWMKSPRADEKTVAEIVESRSSISEPIAIPLNQLERVEVLNRAKLLRPPTARLHLEDGTHLDLGIVASPTTANFRPINNLALDDLLSHLPAEATRPRS